MNDFFAETMTTTNVHYLCQNQDYLNGIVYYNKEMQLKEVLQINPIDSRYYKIKILKLKLCSDTFRKQAFKSQSQNKKEDRKEFEREQYKIGCKLGGKSGSVKASFLPGENIISNFQQRIFFPYTAQQVMLFSLSPRLKQKAEIPKGMAHLFLTPLIKMPFTKHEIDINMVKQKPDKSIDPTTIAVLTIELQFLMSFQATIQLQLSQAHLTLNPVTYGQMSPFVFIKINNKEIISEKAQGGGIHPIWKKPEKGNKIIHDRENEETKSKITKKSDNKRSTNDIKSQETNMSYEFDINSVNNQMQLTMYSSGQWNLATADFVACATVNLQEKEFFLKPKKHVKIENIQLYNESKDKTIGTISLISKFNYEEEQKQKNEGYYS